MTEKDDEPSDFFSTVQAAIDLEVRATAKTWFWGSIQPASMCWF
jgi:hypothetical protein